MCFRESKGNKSEKTADLCEEVSLEMTGASLLGMCGTSAQDRAALKVSWRLKFYEVEGWESRDGGKIGRPVIGELASTKNEQAINLFPGGAKLIEIFQGVDKSLISNNDNLISHERMLNQNHGTPKTVMKRYLSKSMISAMKTHYAVRFESKEDCACVSQC